MELRWHRLRAGHQARTRGGRHSDPRNAWATWAVVNGRLEQVVRARRGGHEWEVRDEQGKTLAWGISLEGQRSAKRRATLAAQRLLP